MVHVYVERHQHDLMPGDHKDQQAEGSLDRNMELDGNMVDCVVDPAKRH